MKKINHEINTDYLESIYKTPKFIDQVNKMVLRMKDFRKNHKFDAIAFTGTSGAAMAYILSYKLKLPLICVRKDDKNHFGQSIEGCISALTYVIVDDFISSGSTIIRIHKQIKKEMPEAKPVAVFLYSDRQADRYFPLSDGKIPIKRLR